MMRGRLRDRVSEGKVEVSRGVVGRLGSWEKGRALTWVKRWMAMT